MASEINTTSEPVKRLNGHTDWVYKCIITGDEQYIFSCSYDKTVKMWQAQTGECLQTFSGHSDWVSALSNVTSDQQYIVSGGYDNTLRKWNISTGQCDHIFEGHTNWIMACSITSDDAILVSGSKDNSIKLWNLASGICMNTLTGHCNDIYGLCISHDQTLLASSGGNGEIKTWSLSTGEEVDVTFHGHSGWVYSVAFSSDDTQLLSGGGDESIRVHSVQDGRPVHTLEKCHTDAIKRCCWLSDELIVSCSGDGTIKVWNVSTSACIHTYRASSEYIFDCCVSASGHWIISASQDKSVGIWSTDPFYQSINVGPTQDASTIPEATVAEVPVELAENVVLTQDESTMPETNAVTEVPVEVAENIVSTQEASSMPEVTAVTEAPVELAEDAWKEILKTKFKFKPKMIAMFDESGYGDEDEWADMTDDELADMGVMRGFLKRWRRTYPAPGSTSVKKAAVEANNNISVPVVRFPELAQNYDVPEIGENFVLVMMHNFNYSSAPEALGIATLREPELEYTQLKLFAQKLGIEEDSPAFIRRVNLTGEHMFSLNDYVTDIAEKNPHVIVIIYFGGHGMTFTRSSVTTLIGVDGVYMASSDVINSLQHTATIFMLDCCREYETKKKYDKKLSRGGKITNQHGALVVFGCKVGNRVQDGNFSTAMCRTLCDVLEEELNEFDGNGSRINLTNALKEVAERIGGSVEWEFPRFKVTLNGTIKNL